MGHVFQVGGHGRLGYLQADLQLRELERHVQKLRGQGDVSLTRQHSMEETKQERNCDSFYIYSCKVNTADSNTPPVKLNLTDKVAHWCCNNLICE